MFDACPTFASVSATPEGTSVQVNSSCARGMANAAEPPALPQQAWVATMVVAITLVVSGASRAKLSKVVSRQSNAAS
jgi:hypothetical protein